MSSKDDLGRKVTGEFEFVNSEVSLVSLPQKGIAEKSRQALTEETGIEPVADFHQPPLRAPHFSLVLERRNPVFTAAKLEKNLRRMSARASPCCQDDGI